MAQMVLFEDAGFANLLPILYWRTVFEIRCGATTFAERLARRAGCKPGGLWTRNWIAPVARDRFDLPVNQPVTAGDVLVNGRWIPDAGLSFPPPPCIATCDGEIAFVVCDHALAQRLAPDSFLDPDAQSELANDAPPLDAGGSMIRYPWDILEKNTHCLVHDWKPEYALLDGSVHPAAVLIEPRSIRIEKGATVMPGAVIDATDGPVILETGSTVRPHACICGPACIAAGSVINPHAYIHGGTSIGPVCKIGGEVDACVFQGYANKQHHGFLGHAFVAGWVNLGAGTVNSDLKNTYGRVRVPINGQPVDTGKTFVGAVIADYSKTAIQTAIPTGAVIGFAVNTAVSRLLPQFVRSFAWMTDRGLHEGDPQKLISVAKQAMARRNVTMTEAEEQLFQKLPQIVAYFEPTIEAQRHAMDGTAQVRVLAPAAQPEGPASPPRR